jgi:catechol 2,3-dioxygenase-like lactoylglutathione lyase family enzyme
MPRSRKPPTNRRPELYFFAATIMVSDRERSVRWYREKLGFEVIQDLGHWVTVGHRGSNGLLHLCQGTEIGEELSPGNQGITIHVRGDFERTVGELAANGVELDAPVTRRPWGMYARIADPDGNVLTLNPED